ncbi:multiple coagulation factor deficiency protein 2 homolog [Pogonomyrmex barbatus]|uniref:Multiple coagulation factor deficiency protein 2 homolog n=1 Tax=Pogonomyrmex barbatus TaxID=144034 RepID=A0A6I9XE92_9HYME|nr:multiple coagulation factor deficiency protein 2 homolog [Pogonomyrmex barbatus]
MKTSRTDSKMEIIFLISFCLGLATGFRGPHHPRSSVSHHHYTPQKEVKLTQDAELLHDATHLKEDMGYIGNQLDFSKMSEQEIEFHYFQIHDIDNNTKLDGLEIFHALEHTLHESDEEDTMQDTEQDLIIELIDKVLEEDDLNNDGYLEYVEFVLGRQRDHIAQEKRNKFKIET